jgi:CBS domain-containing protein
MFLVRRTGYLCAQSMKEGPVGQSVREVMTGSVITVAGDASLADVSRLMRDHDVGDVLLVDDGRFSGIVTDRDIVVRAIADDRLPTETPVEFVATHDVFTVSPDDQVKDVVQAIRGNAVRRIPVVDDGKPVGIVSIGDLAIERDPSSALADISAAPPNN